VKEILQEEEDLSEIVQLVGKVILNWHTFIVWMCTDQTVHTSQLHCIIQSLLSWNVDTHPPTVC